MGENGKGRKKREVVPFEREETGKGKLG